MVSASLECMGVRCIEAAIMDNGIDMDSPMTPFDAGLGRFVDLDSDADFIGKAALFAAPREPRFFGMVPVSHHTGPPDRSSTMKTGRSGQ